jgi:hypothetical protein
MFRSTVNIKNLLWLGAIYLLEFAFVSFIHVHAQSNPRIEVHQQFAPIEFASLDSCQVAQPGQVH